MFSVTVPSWRATKDISIKDDLVEEVGRMVGYDSITPRAPLVPASVPPGNPERKFQHEVRNIFVDQGFTEVYNYSFLSEEAVRAFGIDPQAHVRVTNPDRLRPGADAAIAAAGHPEERHGERQAPRSVSHFRDRPGDSQAPGGTAGRDPAPGGRDVRPRGRARRAPRGGPVRAEARRRMPDAGAWRAPRRPRCTSIPHGRPPSSGGARPWAGFSSCIRRWWRPGARRFWISICGIVQRLAAGAEAKYKPIRRYPSSAFDLSVIAGLREYAGELESRLRGFAGPLVESIQFVRQYSGPPLAEGQKSVSFRLTVGSSERTLSSEEVGEIRARIIEGMRGLGYDLRV